MRAKSKQNEFWGMTGRAFNGRLASTVKRQNRSYPDGVKWPQGGLGRVRAADRALEAPKLLQCAAPARILSDGVDAGSEKGTLSDGDTQAGAPAVTREGACAPRNEGARFDWGEAFA